MRITIDLDDKLCERIKGFCKLNKMTYTEYLSKIIEKQFNLDMFGDLNDKIKKKQEPILKRVELDASQETCNNEKQVEELVSQPVLIENNDLEENTKTRRKLKVK